MHRYRSSMSKPADATRALYERAHRLVIAARAKEIAEIEGAAGAADTPIGSMLRSSIAAYHDQTRRYLDQHEAVMGGDDHALMRRYLAAVRRVYGREPEFAFLSEK